MILEKINKTANLWEKTKNPKYKDLWYKLVKEFANVQDVNNINTNTIVRWNVSKRKIRFGKTNGDK